MKKGRPKTLPTVKICIICSKEWRPVTRYQASRNLTCSPECNKTRMSITRKSKTPRMLTCLNCGQSFRPKSHTSLKKAKFCSPSCNAQHRTKNPVYMEHLRRIAGDGRKGWTEESMQSYLQKMTGEKNPAWNGGVTYKHSHG